MSAALELQPAATISRFRSCLDTEASVDSIEWPVLFEEFSRIKPFLGEKKHPGWSPANFDLPRRAKANVRVVTALVLDFDNKGKDGERVAEPITVDQIAEVLADHYGHIHTTRSNTPDWPRFRVVLPLSRPVTSAEYSQLWHAADRRWPGSDPATKDPSRFWYTPGIIGGAECFEFRDLSGAFLDPDELLTEPETIANFAAPAAELLEKRARAYVEKMPPAISGAGGHAALWNVARKLVADFGLDQDAAFKIIWAEYNPRCQPPWSEKEIRHKLEDASKNAIVRVSMDDTPTHAGAVPQAHDGEIVHKRDDWLKFARHDKGGNLTKDVGNIILLLKYDPGLRDALGFDTLAQRIVWMRQPNFQIGIEQPEAGTELADHHAAYVQHVMAKVHGLSVSKEVTWQALEAAAHENEFHPVQDYLRSCVWDGKRRFGRWLHVYLGAADTDYNAAVGRWWMISAVARAFRPGCQADHVLILEGKQGEGKSQAVRTLSEPWTLGRLPNIRDEVRAANTIGSAWVVEIAELDAIKGAGMTRVKEFVTQQWDKYRPAYARNDIHRPRSCVFIGTTNESTYLTDATGARRFWPAHTGKIDLASLTRDRDQLWAEARAAFEAGEQWHPDESVDIGSEQEARREIDPWEEPIGKYVSGRDTVVIADLLNVCLNMDPAQQDVAASQRAANCLRALGWDNKRVYDKVLKAKVWKWVRLA
jgi:predicted P-loop ATPase